MKTPKRKQKQTSLQPRREATSPASGDSALEPKQSGFVETLQEKYKDRLARAAQELKAEEKHLRRLGHTSDLYLSDLQLFSKWAYRVGKGWYGFSLGHIPPVWLNILNEFLEWLEVQCPDFEIHQVKIKFGLRFYVGTKTSFVIPDKKIRGEIQKLEQLLRFPPMENHPQPSRPLRKKRR